MDAHELQNKKKSNVGSSAKKGGSSGSRFSTLQDGKDDENDESVLLFNDNPTISKPPIVKLCKASKRKRRIFRPPLRRRTLMPL